MTSKDTKHWQVVENVVAAIEKVRSEIPDVIVQQKVQVPSVIRPGRNRDVDVLVTIPVQGRVLRLGIDAKDGSRPVTLDEMGAVVDLKNDIQLNGYCVVSTSGFSDEAVTRAKENGIELQTLEETNESPFWGAPVGQTVHQYAVDVLKADFTFTPDVVRDRRADIGAIEGVPAREMRVVNAKGEGPMHVFLEKQGQHAATLVRSEHGRALADGEVFSLVIKMDQSDTRVFVRERELPQPIAMTVLFRYRTWTVEERRFRFLGWDITTSETMIDGQPRQVTLIAVPSEENPALRKVHLSIGPARPPRTTPR